MYYTIDISKKKKNSSQKNYDCWKMLYIISKKESVS